MTIKTRKNQPNTPTVSFFGYVYSNSCGYCKDFKFIWDELVPLLTAKNIKHDRFEVGVVPNKDINHRAGAVIDTDRGVPNIFKVVNHKVQYYDGGERTAASIMKWLDNTLTGGGHVRHHLLKKGGKVRFNRRTKKGYSTLGFINSLKKKYRKTPFFRR